MSSRLTLAASRRVACRLVSLVAGASLILGAASAPSVAATADRTVPTSHPATLLVGAQASLTSLTAQQVAGNPLAGRPWGVYKGGAEMPWAPYAKATGANHVLLAKIALRPKATWFGAWISNAHIASSVHEYIANAQAGNPNALVQMTVFRLVPWEQDACRRLPTAADGGRRRPSRPPTSCGRTGSRARSGRRTWPSSCSRTGRLRCAYLADR